MRVENFNGVKNQFIITDTEFVVFQSYNSAIVKKNLNSGQITLDRKFWNYSNTTSKYRNLFLNETTKETKKKIDSGIYKLENLN